MARTLDQTIAWATYFVGNRALALGTPAIEPAITSANMVIQVMLSPPFKWRWNRASVDIAFAGGDTAQAIANFGFIEKAYVTALSGSNINKGIEIPNIATELAKDSSAGRPQTICPYLDDNAGNITFRFMPGNPDVSSTVSVIYQKKPVALAQTSDSWPIPDEYGYIYHWGFLALVYLFADSAKFMPANQKFISSLLALAEGLSEQQIAVFLGQWDFFVQNQMRQQKTIQGIQGRGI